MMNTFPERRDVMARTLNPVEILEQDLLTARRKALWRPFVRGVRRYRLIQPGDNIAVCVSGGKDSLLLAALMRLLRRHHEVPFEYTCLLMDPGYSPEHRRAAEDNLRALELPYTLVESDVFEAAAIHKRHPCFMCARMRRGCLYRHAQALGCNKLALGHHFDDVVETTLMAMLYGGQIQAMLPKLKSKNHPGMEVIRPMALVRERDIIDWQNARGLRCPQCACRLASRSGDSARQRVKALIAQLDAENPKVSQNIFNSIHTVQLDALPGWKYRGVAHSFLDDYDECHGDGSLDNF